MIDTRELAELMGPLVPPQHELAALADALERPARPAIRLNPLGRRLDPRELPFRLEPVPWWPQHGFWVVGDARRGGTIGYAAGAHYPQDAGSLLAVALLDPRPRQVICDLCASPGGKASAIIEVLGTAGALLANEPVRSRLPPLRSNMARQGVTRWVGTSVDPARLCELTPGCFDAVLVDAPCSGQAIFARGKQTRRAFDPALVRHSAARQRRILGAAVELVRPGGRLVYSTCTFSWLENEQQVIDLCSRRREMVPHPCERLADWRSPSPAPPGCYRLYPHRDGCGGAFAARLTRREAAATTIRRGPSARRRREPTGPSRAEADPWGRWVGSVVRSVRGSVECAWPADMPDWLIELGAFGPEASFRKGRTWFPAYALAMRRDGSFEPAGTVDLSDSDASAFLLGHSVRGERHGWTVVCHRGLPLGWAKGNGRVLANHLPHAARQPVS